VGVPSLAQVADRAGPDGVLAVVDLGDQPAEGDLGLPALTPDGPRDVALLTRLGVLAGEGADLPRLLPPRWRIDPAMRPILAQSDGQE